MSLALLHIARQTTVHWPHSCCACTINSCKAGYANLENHVYRSSWAIHPQFSLPFIFKPSRGQQGLGRWVVLIVCMIACCCWFSAWLVLRNTFSHTQGGFWSLQWKFLRKSSVEEHFKGFPTHVITGHNSMGVWALAATPRSPHVGNYHCFHIVCICMCNLHGWALWNLGWHVLQLECSLLRYALGFGGAWSQSRRFPHSIIYICCFYGGLPWTYPPFVMFRHCSWLDHNVELGLQLVLACNWLTANCFT